MNDIAEPRHVVRLDRDIDVADLAHPAWGLADNLCVDHYWSGSAAPARRHFTVNLLWSDQALFVRFDAAQHEPLVLCGAPDTTAKTIGLWERDVCEMFLAPVPHNPHRYFEFEIAPTGEWLDLALDSGSGERITDWEYQSGLTAAASIEADRVVMGMRVPFTALGGPPRSGDVWRGNFFRCIGSGDARGYLAWQPTLTEIPNFHVPLRFGYLHFA